MVLSINPQRGAWPLSKVFRLVPDGKCPPPPFATRTIVDSFPEQAIPTEDVSAAHEPGRITEFSKLMVMAFKAPAEQLGFKIVRDNFPTKALGFAVWHVSEP